MGLSWLIDALQPAEEKLLLITVNNESVAQLLTQHVQITCFVKLMITIFNCRKTIFINNVMCF